MALYKLTRPFYDSKGKLHDKGDLLHLPEGSAPKGAVLMEEEKPVAAKAKSGKDASE